MLRFNKIILILCLSTSVIATANTQQFVQQKLEYTHELLLSKLLGLGSNASLVQVQQVVENIISPIIDIPYLVNSVLAQHLKNSSKQQQDAFSQQIQKSVVQAYSYPIIALDRHKLKSMSIKYLSQQQQSSGDILVMYNVEINKQTAYKLGYWMSNAKKRGWNINNIMISDINLLLAWRKHLNEYMSVYNQDLNMAIDLWAGFKLIHHKN